MTLADIWQRIEALKYRYHACHICDARYSHNDSLKSISEMFMMVLNIFLSIVGFNTFRVFAKLSKHMHVHTGDKPFKCEICGKEVSTKCSLVSHVIICL